MLKELRIKNLAIIDDIRLRFEPGLNVLTGETGAGKSIFVDALGLALGDRAQSDMIKSGKEEAVVEAFFDVSDHHLLTGMGINSDEGIIVRRHLSSSGKSRAYINDSIVSIQSLSDLGRSLVDMHGQHEHQSLISTENQKTIIDFYGRLQDKRVEVEELFYDVQSLKNELARLKANVKDRAHRIDLLSFQINEIDSASLKPGEKDSLEEERGILFNLSKLSESADIAYSLLYEAEGSCIEKLSTVASKLRDMASIDHSIKEILNLVESAMPLLKDCSISLRRLKEKYNLDPKRLETVEERLETIKRLEKKYGEGIEEVLNYRAMANKELSELNNTDEKIDIIEGKLKDREEMLMKIATELSQQRKKTALELSKSVEKILGELAFEKAKFSIAVNPTQLCSHGIDSIEFQFSANPGETLKPLSKVASGGELSRVMLAIKNVLADVDRIPVLIFDEVDAGIGGRTAESVARKLKGLAKTHQVICITHLPQIASIADFHIMTEKYQKKDGVGVRVKELSADERRSEIARMLSGMITDTSLKHASELLGGRKSQEKVGR